MLDYHIRESRPMPSIGLTYNATLETGGLLLGDDVNITLDVQFVKAA